MIYCPICEPELTGVFLPVVCWDCSIALTDSAKTLPPDFQIDFDEVPF